MANLCESLLRLQPDLTIGPGLAASFSHPTPTTWVYDLRKGVRFWDGHPMTPQDVIFSLDRQRSSSSFWYTFSSTISNVQQTGPMQVTVTTKQPNVVTNDAMALGLGVVIEKQYAESKGSAYGTAKGGVMCTGPFRLSQWNPGENIIETKNPTYWDKSHPAMTDKLTLQFINSDSTLTNGLLSGELDGAYDVPQSAVSSLDSSSTGKMYLGHSLRYYPLWQASENGPVKDPKIRQALSLAVDRQGIAHADFNDLATPLRWIAPPDSFGYARSTWQQAYDAMPDVSSPNLSKAQQLVKEAGSPTAPISIAAQAGDEISTELATATASAGKQAGLNTTIKELPPTQYDNLYFDPKARAGISYFVGSYSYIDVAEPLETALNGAASDAPYNLAGVSNPSLDRMLTKAVGISDDTKRAQLGTKVIRVWSNELTQIPLVTAPEFMFLNSKITGAPASFTTFLYSPWAQSLGASG
ncbi:MAG: ABC transporter substrate-binding protein [Solirubrobacterales bacterium]